MFTPESRAFLTETARTGKIATVRADGRPHVVPIWYYLDGDTIVFTTWHTTVKAANIRRDPRVSICVDDEAPPYAFALVDGIADTSDDLDQLVKYATLIAARYMGPDLAEAYGKRNGVAGEYLVRVTPTKVIYKESIAD
ncbi:MAG: PPOX class F420-dependent oxidoreductase [Chloroflexota bacterium]